MSRPGGPASIRIAWVAPTAQVGQDVAIYPFAYVGDGVVLGDGTTLHPGAVIGDRCRLGKDCIIHPNAVLYADVDLAEIGSKCTPAAFSAVMASVIARSTAAT